MALKDTVWFLRTGVLFEEVCLFVSVCLSVCLALIGCIKTLHFEIKLGAEGEELTDDVQ